VTTVVTTILVDSCVIIDLLAAESDWYEWAMATISGLSESRALAINQIIYAEIAAVYDTPADLELALAPFEFIRLSLPWEAAFLSDTAYRIYRQRGGHRRSPLPDFYIGAHAMTAGMALLTRDQTRYRGYFPRLRLITPTTE
jgi:predicted nucleic acid-binding protein